MIGYFPSLYQDELLYSWFARYHEQSGNESPKRTMNELFNSNKIVAVLDIPSNLSQVYKALNHFDIPEVEFLIQQHTLFKYYTFFQAGIIQKKVLNYMKYGGKPGSSHLLLGINASTISEWKYIRFCPICNKEDIDKYGEPYWHVSHQLPKSFYCTKHNELLVDSPIEVRKKYKHKYISASNIIQVKRKNKILYTPKTEQHLKMISKENNKLIQIDFDNIHEEIQEIYKYLLKVNGYSNYFGNINQLKLAEQFIKYYGQELLELVDSKVEVNNESCWLKAITRKHRKAFHPIHHILLMNFLGANVDSLKELVGKKYKPFGEPPYICLNSAADHYKKRVIDQVTVTLCTDTRRPVGTFKCECGFIYSRRGPDKKEEDQYCIGRVKNYGRVWQETLKNLLYDKGLSFSQAARFLNCDVGTVKKYAVLEFIDKKDCIEDTSDIKALKEREWLELINANPTLSITSIRKLNQSIYSWHYRNNQEWLKDNSPKNSKIINRSSRVDWESRDFETLEQIKQIIKELYSKEKPVFVNKTLVSKYLNTPSLVEKHLNKLPKTKEFLINHLESRIDFQVRRLLWSYNQLYDKGEDIKAWKIRRLAGFRKPMDKKIEKILDNIEEWGGYL